MVIQKLAKKSIASLLVPVKRINKMVTQHKKRTLMQNYWDQYQYLGNCSPTPPLAQQQSIDNKSKLMLG